MVDKYLPKEFDVYWLNYGKYNDKLFRGKYVELDYRQLDGAYAWARYIKEYILKLEDEKIIFSLDDYLLTKPLKIEKYNQLVDAINNEIVCARLNYCGEYRYKAIQGREYFNAQDGYLCVAQYCIWNRWALISILEKVKTPWEFEEEGTKIMRERRWKTIGFKESVLDYPVTGALSRKWGGIRTIDNNPEDIQWLKENGYL